MRKVKEALHKLLVTPVYLFPKSRSTRYLGIDQVKDHDIPFIKDYLTVFDRLLLSTYFNNDTNYIEWRNIYIHKLSILPIGDTFPNPLPYPNLCIRVSQPKRTTQMHLAYFPPITEGYEVEFNMFFDSFRLQCNMPTGVPVNWYVFVKIIKLEDYERVEG